MNDVFKILIDYTNFLTLIDNKPLSTTCKYIHNKINNFYKNKILFQYSQITNISETYLLKIFGNYLNFYEKLKDEKIQAFFQSLDFKTITFLKIPIKQISFAEILRTCDNYTIRYGSYTNYRDHFCKTLRGAKQKLFEEYYFPINANIFYEKTLIEKDIEILMDQTICSYEIARKTLISNKNDVVDAIMFILR